MSKITQSHSQLLFTFGPGAMVDLPDHAAIVGGLDGWDRYAGRPVEESRLTDLLQTLSDERGAGGSYPTLFTPPFEDDEKHGDRAPGIPVMIFPEWFVCDADGSADGDEDGARTRETRETRRRLVRFSNVEVAASGKLSFADGGRRKTHVNPIRFVGACSKGHLEDLNWQRIVHAGREGQCRRSLYWTERGVSSDPSDLAVRCECGARVSLSELYQPGRLGTCRGHSPWLPAPDEAADGGAEGGESGCGEDLRLLPRSATNAYFPQTLTIISLPEADHALTAAIERHWSTIASLINSPGVTDAIGVLTNLPGIGDDLRGHDEAAIRDAVARRGEAAGSGAGGSGAADPRIEEFDRFTADVDEVGHDGADSRLFAERLDMGALDVPARLAPLIESVVRVHWLREVACLYGFTRLEPAPTAMESELDDINLKTEGAPLARAVDWYPAIEQFGEGIFVRLASSVIADWQGRDAVETRIDQLRAGEKLDAKRREREPEYLGPAYWALHTFSHAFMAELALDCGYPLASLKERIYASKPGQTPRHGLLVYTAASGGQGTLGGLSHMAARAPVLLERALERMDLCSNDPVCGEHKPDDHHDDRHLHGAACHACLLVPETSCEARNGRLDRRFFQEGHAAALA